MFIKVGEVDKFEKVEKQKCNAMIFRLVSLHTCEHDFKNLSKMWGKITIIGDDC